MLEVILSGDQYICDSRWRIVGVCVGGGGGEGGTKSIFLPLDLPYLPQRLCTILTAGDELIISPVWFTKRSVLET